MVDLKVENVENWGLEVLAASFPASGVGVGQLFPSGSPELTGDAWAVCL